MKNIYIVYLSALISTVLHAQTVVFLQGSSRSGKSSICSMMEQQEQWNTVGSMYFPFCLDTFATLFPEQFVCIQKGIASENIRHAVTRDMFMFNKGISERHKQKIIDAARYIQDYFSSPMLYAQHKKEFSDFSLHEIQKSLKTGNHLLADVSWYVTREQLTSITPTPTIISALVYCPLIIAIDRLVQRNAISLETGSIMNYRFFSEPLMSFMALYDLSLEDDNAIDTLDKTQLLKCLDNIEKYISVEGATNDNSGFMMHELTRQKLDEYRTLFLHTFANNQTLYIRPKKMYDIILRTDKYTAKECVQKLISHLTN